MSTQKTEHLKLHAWEESDDFLREEFNENFDKIDKKLFEKGRVAAGIYVGNGASGQTISLGFTPQAVLVTPASASAWDITMAGLAINGYPSYAWMGGSSGATVTIVVGGFKIGQNNPSNTNRANEKYHYMAVG